MSEGPITAYTISVCQDMEKVSTLLLISKRLLCIASENKGLNSKKRIPPPAGCNVVTLHSFEAFVNQPNSDPF
jgi:hypothetical protein